MSMGTDNPLDQPLPTPGAATSPASRTDLADDPRFAIRIGRDGTWFYRGSPIHRLELVKLFASVLRREGDHYWLVTPAERGRIEVEDAPFVAVGLEAEGVGRGQKVRLRTNVDEWVTLGAAQPLRLRRPAGQPADAGPVPYVEVRDGLEARLTRSVYYDLVELGEAHDEPGASRFGVWSDGCFFALDEA